MAWWEVLDHPSLDSIGGILLWALALTAVLLVIALGCAFGWQKWKEAQKRRERERARNAAASSDDAS